MRYWLIWLFCGFVTVTAAQKKPYNPGFTRIGFEFLGAQPVQVNDGASQKAKSQIGFDIGTVSWTNRFIHPEAIIGYRRVDLSNIDSIGIAKHHELYILAGARYFPDDKFYDKQWILTFSALGGLSMRGASIGNQFAFDALLSGGVAFSLTKGYKSTILVFEAMYRPLGSDAISGINLLPSYTFGISVLQFVNLAD